MALDPNNFLSYSVWLALPMDIRYKIASLFGFSARGIRETMDGRILSDGFVHADLAVITKERMREITGSGSDDFYELFRALVYKLENPVETLNADVQQKEPEEASPAPKRGRKKKGGE